MLASRVAQETTLTLRAYVTKTRALRSYFRFLTGCKTNLYRHLLSGVILHDSGKDMFANSNDVCILIHKWLLVKIRYAYAK